MSMTDDPRPDSAATGADPHATRDERPKAWSDDEPRLIRVMLRPRWILLLIVALAIAGAFAALGHWQLSRSVIQAEVTDSGTETVLPVSQVVTPGSAPREAAIGQRVEAEGAFIAANTTIVTNRVNDGVLGYWVVGSLIEGGQSPARVLPVALGWTKDRAQAEAVAARITAEGATAAALSGRLSGSEAPSVDEDLDDPFELTSMSVAALINQWQGMDGTEVYGVYLVSDEAPEGLTTISSSPPVAETTVNWLNIFYAAEWIVFAGFAVFLWFRLARDAREREIDERIEADRSASGTP